MPRSPTLVPTRAAPRFAAALLFALAATGAGAETPLTVQVINDSGHEDYNVFLLLGGQAIKLANGTVLPFSAANVATVDTSAASPNQVAGTLGCPTGAPTSCSALPVAGASITSPYSGKARTTYSFSVTTAGSGTLYLSYGTPITYTSAPTVYTQARWQLVELSYDQNIASVGDLTSIDFFGIPIEMTTFAAGDTAQAAPLTRSTYYSSTETLLKSLYALNANMGYAMRTTSGGTFTPGTTDISQFARVVGPNQMAAPGSSMISPTDPNYAQGSPFPYPSFADYLDSLVAASYTFVEKDDATISAYVFNYAGTVTGNRTSGYTITLTGTTQAPSPLPSNATITLNLPPQATASGGFDFNIYGAPQSCDSFAVAGYACDTNTLQAMANSVYGWIQADVISALNFGYLNGAIDQANGGTGNSSAWYGLPPVPYPFGAARSVNDGFYNPWAAAMYNQSDAYGFAFSDRNGRPSPGVALPTGGTLRVWLLPDKRLDAPRINATSPTCGTTAGSCSVGLQWPAAKDATGYVLTVQPPYSGTVVDVAPNAGLVKTTLSKLDPGTNYTITAVAQNSHDHTQSTTLTTQVAMPGSPPAWTAGDTAFVGGFNWDPPSYPSLPPVAGTPIGASGAMLSVFANPSALAMAFQPTSTSAPGAGTLTVQLINTAPASTLAVPFVVSFSAPVDLTDATGDCPGVTLANGQVVMATGTGIPMGGCTFSVGVHVPQADVYVASTSAYQLANGIQQPPAYAALTAAAAGAAAVTLTPAATPPGTAANLQVQLSNGDDRTS